MGGFEAEQSLALSIQLTLGQLRSRAIRVFGNDLAKNSVGLITVTQTQFHISEFVQRIRNFVVLRVRLTNFSERLSSTLQISLGKIHFSQPILGVTRIRTARILAEKSSKGLTGLIKVFCLDKVKCGVVIELFLFRIGRLNARRLRRRATVWGLYRTTGIDGTSS